QELDGVAYRAEPSLIALVGTVTPTAQVRATSGVDVIANAKRVLHLGDAGVGFDVAGALLAGAWDTVIEREFVAAAGRTAENAVGAGQGALRPVEAADGAGLLAAGVPPQALSAVRNDMNGGYVILVPAATPGWVTGADAEPVAPKIAGTAGDALRADWTYWRVDPTTGEALRMNAAGRGAAMAEFVVGLQVGMTVNAALAVPGLMLCHSSGAPWQCYCDTVATGVLLGLGGALFGALAGANAVMIYAMVDIGVVAPVSTFYSSPICTVMWGSLDGSERAGSAGAGCWAA
ncbi:MAG TPA: hypothetical protein VFN03_04685, partial [Trueperaceae bacterium]|nr:hypothetical protein [Trueperaceae bacterium]